MAVSTPMGRLEKVELCKGWQNEAAEFTPWLAREENLKLLGDAIDLDLEFESLEKNVGPFRADILCKDTATSDWVLIENQLKRTDHTHLGQLLTYASGLKAVTIVWIAGRFTDEHRSTLDWLNEITDKRFNFFGLEIELWQIEGSPFAPKFNIVSKPNDWAKNMASIKGIVESGALTEAKKLQMDFWIGIKEFMLTQESGLKATKPAAQHYMNFAIGRSGFRIAAVALPELGEIRIDLIMDGDSSKQCFAELKAEQLQIDRELGEQLIWHSPSGKKMCRVISRRVANLADRSLWPEYHEWLVTRLKEFQRAFGVRIKKLSGNVQPMEEMDSGQPDSPGDELLE